MAYVNSSCSKMVLPKRKVIRWLSLGGALLLFCLPVFSQLNLGRIFGGVTDQSGGVIVGAKVTILDVERGVTRPLTSDSAGEFSAPSLTPGTYTVRVEATGFKTSERTDVVVGVGQDIRVDFIVQPGEQAQTVTVSGEAPQVNTTNAQLGGNIENQQLSELPINGRQYLNLLDAKPGVLSKPGNAGTRFVANGAPSNETVWMFDGLQDINVTNATGGIVGENNGGGGGTDQQTILSADAIQEVNIIENPKAEYGWKVGAVVNVGLKSGTNDIHGTAVVFGRDSALDAKNPFLGPTQSKAAMDLKQYGGTVGGPIKKDKLFFFAAYEGQNYTVGNPRIAQLPTTTDVSPGNPSAGANASFPDAIEDMLINHPSVPVSQLSLNLAGCTVAGTTATCNAANGVFGNSGPSSADPIAPNTFGGSNSGLGKIDYHINDHNTLNGELFYGLGNFSNTSGVVQQYWETDMRDSYARVIRAVWAWTPNSNWLNEARFGWDNYNGPVLVAECTRNVGQPNYAQQFGFVTGLADNPPSGCGFPVLTITGFTALGGQTTIQTEHFNMIQGSDSVSYTRGKHLFKFGGELRTTLFNGGNYNGSRGTIPFGSTAAFSGASALEDFMAGTANGNGGSTVLVGQVERNLIINAYALFAQDDYRLTPRITANLGLRWEFEPSVKERNNLFGNFNPNTPTGLVQETSGQNVYSGDKDAFGPRLGIAWDVTGKGTTVVRAGAGIVFTSLNLLNLTQTSGATLNATPTGFSLEGPSGTVQGPGNITTGNLSYTITGATWKPNTPIFSGSGSLACGTGAPNPPLCLLRVIEPNLRMPFLTTYTLGVQHAFSNNLSMDVAYVGNHGDRFFQQIDLNQPTAGAKTSEQLRRPYNTQFPYFSQILELANSADSNFNSLQAGLTYRATHGLAFSVGYTYSHNLDNPGPPMNPSQPRLDYGSDIYDARHQFSLTGTYTIPGIKSPGQLLEGWQVNTVVHLISSFAWSANDTGDDISGTGELRDRWDLFGNPKDFTPGGPGTLPCFGYSAANNPYVANTLSTFGKAANCSTSVPVACVNAAQSVPTGPTGQTGVQALGSYGCYMEGNSVIVPPTQGTYGTMAANELRGKGFHSFDVSVTKNWKFKERYTVQFRSEFFNILNSVDYIPALATSLSSPSSFGQATGTPDSVNPIIGTGSPREIQFGMKLLF